MTFSVYNLCTCNCYVIWCCLASEVCLEVHFSSLGCKLWKQTRLVSVPMIAKQKTVLKLAQVYKILHGLCDVPDVIFQTRLAHSSGLASAQTLHCPFAWTNYPSSIRAWNSLDKALVLTPSLQSFQLAHTLSLILPSLMFLIVCATFFVYNILALVAQ